MNIILVYDKLEKKYTVYSSLAGFIEHNPGYSDHTINNYLSRKKQPYEDERLTIMRLPVIGRK